MDRNLHKTPLLPVVFVIPSHKAHGDPSRPATATPASSSRMDSRSSASPMICAAISPSTSASNSIPAEDEQEREAEPNFSGAAGVRGLTVAAYRLRRHRMLRKLPRSRRRLNRERRACRTSTDRRFLGSGNPKTDMTGSKLCFTKPTRDSNSHLACDLSMLQTMSCFA
ncbi:hypothetical protein PAHAL_5G171800 [Panicum hallii]|uniref:Uncharacterized protein n=1 Tax=Panicum hallii TaxID=206008 RepID=A0A2S3HSB4_9POAL|nr:hypothetical protein PAHAL_5G171800 [Panicum hallii]